MQVKKRPAASASARVADGDGQGGGCHRSQNPASAQQVAESSGQDGGGQDEGFHQSGPGEVCRGEVCCVGQDDAPTLFGFTPPSPSVSVASSVGAFF